MLLIPGWPQPQGIPPGLPPAGGVQAPAWK